MDAAGDKWIIGDVINGVKANRAQATQTLNTNTVYPVKVLLEGSTVTLINSNAIKVRWTFASLTARPVALGLRGNGTSDFDNIKVSTEAYPSGGVGNPPAIPPPTSTAGPADVAEFSYANPPFYYNLNDHLGSTRIITNSAGTVTASFEYWPFGEVKSQTGCAANNQKFTGKLFDNESGLQYFGARYLSNELTRFTSVDPADSFDPADPQSWNKYSYSLNNPITYIDPDGRAAALAIPVAIVLVEAALATTVVVLVVDMADGRADITEGAIEKGKEVYNHLREKFKDGTTERDEKRDRQAEKEKDMEDIKETEKKKSDYVPQTAEEKLESIEHDQEVKGRDHIRDITKSKEKARKARDDAAKSGETKSETKKPE